MGRRREYFTRNQWTERVNSTFARRWLAHKSLQKLGRISDESERKDDAFHSAFQEFSLATNLLLAEQSQLVEPVAPRVWAKILQPLEGERSFDVLEPGRAYAVNPEASAMFRTLVFLKHGISFRQLILEIEQNHQRYPKLIDVHRDYCRMLNGMVPLGGLKLKFNFDHFTLMVQGLDFGLNTLNEIELAGCLDEICPCALRHSVGYSKTLQKLIKDTCDDLVSLDAGSSWSIGGST